MVKICPAEILLLLAFQNNYSNEALQYIDLTLAAIYSATDYADRAHAQLE